MLSSYVRITDGQCYYCSWLGKAPSLQKTGPSFFRSLLYVAQDDGFFERPVGIAGGDELLTDVAQVPGACDLFHNWLVVDFLLVADFTTARVAGGVVVADVVLVLSNARDDIAVHNLHVVDVKQQFHPGRADLLDDFHTVVDVVALVAGMALHLGCHPAVEHLQAEVDLLALGVAYYPLVTVDAVCNAHIIGNVLAKTGEGDDVGEAVLGAGVDGVLELL